MGAPLLWKHFAKLQSASTPVVAIAAAGSIMGQIVAVIQAAPVWLFVVAAVTPWLPILALELVWTYRHYRWLSLFCLLLITQTGYLLENLANVVQAHILNQPPTGIFGSALDPRLLHLAWTSWTVAATAMLISRFRRNPFIYLATAIALVDGLFASGDLQLIASVTGIAALNLAFALQLGRTYDAWLARAFPQLPEQVLIDATSRLEEIRLRAGESIEPRGERLYIVTSGSGSLVRAGPGGHEILLRVLAPGTVIRDSGTLKADSALELLAVPAKAI
jgi:hypothetical protein